MRKQTDWQKQRKALAKKILNRIVVDPAFRRQLIENPEVAMEVAGLSEQVEAVEHANLAVTASCRRTCNLTCRGWTCRYQTN